MLKQLFTDYTLNTVSFFMMVIFLDMLLRLVPSKKPISTLALLSRIFAKLAVWIRKLSDVLPERRK